MLAYHSKENKEYEVISIRCKHATLRGKDIQYLSIDESTPTNENEGEPTLNRPLYARNSEDGWVGLDMELDVMTNGFSTLKELKKEFKACKSTGFKNDDGDKIYQLIYCPEGYNE